LLQEGLKFNQGLRNEADRLQVLYVAPGLFLRYLSLYDGTLRVVEADSRLLSQPPSAVPLTLHDGLFNCTN